MSIIYDSPGPYAKHKGFMESSKGAHGIVLERIKSANDLLFLKVLLSDGNIGYISAPSLKVIG